MKLTNNLLRPTLSDSSCDLSKYFNTDDREQLYNYSTSYNSETLLLETTDIQNKLKTNHQQISQPAHCENSLISKQQSLLEDLYEQLEITISQEGCTNDGQESKKQKISDLYNICKNLIGTLKKLQTKVQKIEGKQRRSQTSSHKDSQIGEVDSQSLLTYSSLKNSSGRKCDPANNHEMMSNLMQLVQYKSKIEVYKQENQELKKQIIRLEIYNQDMKKSMRRVQGQNFKLKELLKQYQHFNKKQKSDRKMINEKCDGLRRTQGMLSENKMNHSKSNNKQSQKNQANLCFEEQEMYNEIYYNFKSLKQDKQNIKQFYERKMSQEQFNYKGKSTPLTPNLNTTKVNFQQCGKQKQKTDFKSTVFQIQQTNKQQQKTFRHLVNNSKIEKNQKSQGKQRKNVKIFSFEQCKNVDGYLIKRAKNQNNQMQVQTKSTYPFNELIYECQFNLPKSVDKKSNGNLQDYIQTMSSLPQNPQSFCQIKQKQNVNKSLITSPIKQYQTSQKTQVNLSRKGFQN